MNLSQLRYILAVDKFKHFGKAAESEFVTQPTLSMMIKKLEEELGVLIFDRSRKPLLSTEIGKEIIAQARVIIAESERLEEFVTDYQDKVQGDFHLGIIPTVAPYLVPKFLDDFLKSYHDVRLHFYEATTQELIAQLKRSEIDGALLVTPLHDENIVEIPLFYEEFFVFGADLPAKQYIKPSEIDVDKLLLLEEGHCLRSQVVNLCELKEQSNERLNYSSGSMETLIQLVRYNNGITIVPELTALEIRERGAEERVVQFQKPTPYREVSLVVQKNAAQRRFFKELAQTIKANIPDHMLQPENRFVVEI